MAYLKINVRLQSTILYNSAEPQYFADFSTADFGLRKLIDPRVEQRKLYLYLQCNNGVDVHKLVEKERIVIYTLYVIISNMKIALCNTPWVITTRKDRSRPN